MNRVPGYSLAAFRRWCAQNLILDSGKSFDLEPFQRKMLGPHFKGATETVIIVPKKNGKALACDTPILTRSGWSTMGELTEGDEVFAPDGSPTCVVYASPTWTDHACYRVEFSDGQSVVADAGHLWAVHDRYRGYVVATTEEMATDWSLGSQGHRYRVEPPAPPDLPPRELPIAPYLLGAWLGDGATATARITTADAGVRDAFEAAGYSVRLIAPAGLAATYSVLGLQAQLRGLGVLGNKHIPDAYLCGSVEQRLALLQGLMDTDGCVNLAGGRSPRCEFTSVKARLAEDVLALVRSLGWKATLRKGRATLNGVDIGPKFRVSFTARPDRSPFRLARKTERLAAASARRERSRSIHVVGVIRVPSVPVRCIAVEHPSHQFLAGRGLLPTHNTTLLSALALFHLKTVPEAEVVIGASSRDQARILFKQAAGLVTRSGLTDTFSVKGGYGEIRLGDDRTGPRIRVLAADANTADGVIPTLALVDELHRHPSAELYGVFRDGLGPRDGRMITISTAGADVDSPLGLLREKAHEMPRFRRDHTRKVTTASSEDGSFHLFEWALDAADDVHDMRVVKKANPASWHTVSKLRERHDSPSTTPWQWARFACGIWMGAEQPWLTPDVWDACAEPPELEDGDEVVLGLDAGIKHDSTALIIAANKGGTVHVECRIWQPNDEMDEVLDLGVVEQTIRELATRYHVREVAYDPWFFGRSAQVLEEEGLVMVQFNQTNERMCPASQTLFDLVMNGRLRHGGDPLLRKHALAAVAKETERGWRISKTASRKKIDSLVALAMACDRLLAEEGAEPWVMVL